MKVCPVFVIVLNAVLLICILPIECRQAIKPPDDIEVNDKTKVIPYSPTAFSATSGGSCRLDIQNDLPKPNEPQPLYIVPNTSNIWNPNKNGELVVPEGQTIELYCSYSFANTTSETIPINTKTLKPTCLGGKTFSWQGQKYHFGQFVCKKQSRFVVEPIGKRCGRYSEVFRVGFNVTKDRFIESMQICYDFNEWRNQYTVHRLLPGNIHFQRNVQRMNFSKAGFFENHNVNNYYTQRNQKQRVFELFNGNDTVMIYFPGGDTFLARGHLAAKSDFVYANQQRSTFIYLNVAPQWQSFNSGQWAALENAVRKFVTKSDLDVDCYTGTLGTLHLKSSNSNAKEQPFFLAHDKNNNRLLPVPKLYYRVIVDRKNPKRGIALVGVNNPYATIQEIRDSYIICNNIAADIPWLRWIRNTNLKKGYIYACAVDKFSRAAKVLPKTLRYVNEILA